MTQDVANPFAEDADAAALFGSFTEPAPKATPPRDVEDVEKAVKAAAKVAEKSGFHKRAPKKRAVRRSASYETGRNKPLSFRVTDDAFAMFAQMCDRQDWVKGQALVYAMAALQEKLDNPQDSFWDDRNFEGVD